MADWALSSCELTETSTAIANRGAANSKGAYVELIASTGFRYSAVTVQLIAEGGGGQCYLVDIANGAAGSEQVIVPNILLDSMRAASNSTVSLTIPVSVARGSRVAVRVQEVGGSSTRSVRAVVVGRVGGFNYPPNGFGEPVNYGANTSTTNGILVDPGAVANAYGAWTEITAATTRRHNGLIPVLGTNQQAVSVGIGAYYFQIGIGDAGSEIPAFEWMSMAASNANAFHPSSVDFRASIPAGTRIAMRSKCVLSSAANYRHPTAIILGI